MANSPMTLPYRTVLANDLTELGTCAIMGEAGRESTPAHLRPKGRHATAYFPFYALHPRRRQRFCRRLSDAPDPPHRAVRAGRGGRSDRAVDCQSAGRTAGQADRDL